jgi:hypothetical protein
MSRKKATNKNKYSDWSDTKQELDKARVDLNKNVNDLSTKLNGILLLNYSKKLITILKS